MLFRTLAGGLERLTRCRKAAAVAALLTATAIDAQEQVALNPRLVVQVIQGEMPLPDALVRAGRTGGKTDTTGQVTLRVPPGLTTVIASKLGFRPESAQVTMRSGVDTTITMSLEERAAAIGAVIITSTRTERRLEEEPLRVEVLAGEDVSEKPKCDHPTCELCFAR